MCKNCGEGKWKVAADSARVSGVFGVKNVEKSGPDAKKLDIGSH